MINTTSGKYRNDTGPLTTSYSSFDADSLYDTRTQTYGEEEQVSLEGSVPGQKQTIVKGSVTISEKYLAGGEGYDDGGVYGDGEVLVVFQTNANADLLSYVIKSIDELGDDVYYTYISAFYGGMTDEIWNTIRGWFNTTLTVTTSSGTITISDGKRSILVNASTHAMRYNADYYTETSDTSTEYATLQTNGWLVDGTYTYQGANQDWYTIIDSLKAKGIVNATITHDTVNGEITMANGQWSITIADKNLGATTVYNDGDTLSEANCGKYYQRGNNYGFPFTGNVTTSSTRVNATGYGPGNYYSSSTFITGNYNSWSNPANDNLRGNTTNTEAARQGPCSNGYHIPSKTEWENFIKMFNSIRPNAHSSTDFKNTFAIPQAGNRNPIRSVTQLQGSDAIYWSSSPRNSMVFSSYSSAENIYNISTEGCSIRPFKNTAQSS